MSSCEEAPRQWTLDVPVQVVHTAMVVVVVIVVIVGGGKEIGGVHPQLPHHPSHPGLCRNIRIFLLLPPERRRRQQQLRQ